MMDKMKKVLMISCVDIASDASLGVKKKLLGEYEAFSRLGTDAYFLMIQHNCVVLRHEEKDTVLVNEQWNGYMACVRLYDIAPVICKDNQIDLCYIRFPLSDWAFMRMLKRLKKDSKVYVEIPTYPYDKENQRNRNLVSQFNYQQDRINRKKWKQYVDKVITFSDDKEIYGVPCININNGIDVESVKYIGDKLSYDKDITLISVARMRPIHGYDRVISGMAKYYQKNKKPERIVRYLVIGDGPDTEHLKQMVRDNDLELYVEFYGRKSGKELDDLFQKSHIGLAVLAGHREGHASVSDLKSREYCARGVPYITANEDEAIPDDSVFVKKVVMNNAPLDIDDIISYFDFIKAHKEIHQSCRKFAEDHFCWEYQLKRIIDF